MYVRNKAIQLRLAVVTIVAFVLGSHWVLGQIEEAPECEEIWVKIASEVDFATFTAQGMVSGDLEGSIAFVGDTSSPTPILASFLPPLREAVSFTGDLTLVTEDGSITTRNVGVFEPGPFGVGVEFGRVISGSGKYSGATGIFFFAVESDETGSHFSETGQGTICMLDNRRIGACLSELIGENCSGLVGAARVQCNHEQRTVCLNAQ